MSDLADLGVRALLAAPSDHGAEAVEASLARIAERDPALNAFVTTRPEAVAEAHSSAAGPLKGVPIGVKDMFVDRDRAPTVGSRVPASWLTGTAVILQRIRAAGGVVVGYTNLHEWGIGTSSSITATGPILNPWDRGRVTGGSSGGSGAAVAAGLVPAAVGTDAGGSIRIPSACCGVVGFKPTWGEVPMDGFAEGDGALDHIGPIARSVADVRTLFEVLADRPTARADVDGVSVGVARPYFFDLVDDDAREALESGVDALGRAVGKVADVRVSHVERASQAVGLLLLPHTARLLGDRIVERAADFDPLTLKLLYLGRAFMESESVSSKPHPKAIRLLTDERPWLPKDQYLKFPGFPGPIRRFLGKHFFNERQGEFARSAVGAGFERAFDEVDLIVTPTLPGVARRQGESQDLPNVGLNGPMNLAGLPSISVPCGMTPTGLTVSLTITGPQGADDLVLAAGEALEDALDRSYADRIAPGPYAP